MDYIMDTSTDMNFSFQILDDEFPILINNIKEYEKHCVTYLIHNNEQIYIGETSNLKRRIEDHSKNQEKQKKNLIKTKIIISDYFNKSAIYDIETKLINYIYADNIFEVINTKLKQNSHEYYLKQEINEFMFRDIWTELLKRKLVQKSLKDLENSDLFKLSPFKEFSDKQLSIIDKVVKEITQECSNGQEIISFDGSPIKKVKIKDSEESIIISGGPGTGKTLIIVKIIHVLLKRYLLDDAKIAICVPQSSLQSTIKKMLKAAKLKVKVIRPIDLSKNLEEKFDLIIVDEAHRLKQHFNKQSKDIKHLENGKYTELDFAHKKSKHLILMYDKKQTIRPADLNESHFEFVKYKQYQLVEQFRVKKSTNYLRFIESLLQIGDDVTNIKDLGDYDFQIYDSLQKMHDDIKEKDKQYGHCRMGSGYFVPWISKKKNNIFDFEKEGLKAKWNTKIEAWVQDPKSVNEVGCIHTLQGQDLNYAGIIIGDDLYLDPIDGKIKIRKENYYDNNGTPINGTDHDNRELSKYIKNIYYVLLTRGMLGTYVYIKDENLRLKLNEILSNR